MTNEAKKRLLVVDDERGFREYIRDAAGGLGYEVEMATNGLEAREIYKRFQPDVILLDVVMPEADGVEFTRWLALQQTKARIILVTGYNPHYADSTGKLATALGIPGITYLTKPLRLATLSAALAA
ncbi:MAG: response regulator [Alphaproteobacteria bacterium]|nr:response regulator [Alphaproteobacteria bacterium]